MCRGSSKNLKKILKSLDSFFGIWDVQRLLKGAFSLFVALPMNRLVVVLSFVFFLCLRLSFFLGHPLLLLN